MKVRQRQARDRRGHVTTRTNENVLSQISQSPRRRMCLVDRMKVIFELFWFNSSDISISWILVYTLIIQQYFAYIKMSEREDQSLKYRLIELVRDEPMLWNQRDPIYKTKKPNVKNLKWATKSLQKVLLEVCGKRFVTNLRGKRRKFHGSSVVWKRLTTTTFTRRGSSSLSYCSYAIPFARREVVAISSITKVLTWKR